MSETTNISSRGASLRKALLGFGIAAGAAWTLASGFVAPAPKLYSSTPSVKVAIPYRGICQDVQVFRQGQQLTLSQQKINSGLAEFGFELEDGEHQVTVRFSTLLPGLDKEYPLTVVVDQVAPTLTLSQESPLSKTPQMTTTQESILVSGSLDEPEVTVKVGELELPVSGEGQLHQDLALKPGANELELTIQDRAGNQTVQQYSVFRDTEEPELVWKTAPDHAFEATSARLELDLIDDGEILGVSGKVNGDQQVKWFRKGDKRWLGVTPELIDAEHSIEVRVADQAGRVVTTKRQFIINSSENLGEAVLGLGARGADVKLLNERLAEAGYLKDKKKLTSVFTKDTEKALKELQKAEGFEVTGKAEGKALIALGPRIFVNLRKFSLVLDRPGRPQKRWMIASGSWAHPTTPGDFVIKEKVAHPTWLPPKSDWAKDAKPIPPGPGNPLGTRWIGLDWGGLGIHGTNAPWSVGTASSHGCMRMVTSQVEELYELVEVGMPVFVMGGWDDDPRLEKYWPTNPPPEKPHDKPEVKVPQAKSTEAADKPAEAQAEDKPKTEDATKAEDKPKLDESKATEPGENQAESTSEPAKP